MGGMKRKDLFLALCAGQLAVAALAAAHIQLATLHPALAALAAAALAACTLALAERGLTRLPDAFLARFRPALEPEWLLAGQLLALAAALAMPGAA